ncbi:hypothetical protein BDZ91DRAFT_447622 [Kalaharituber pfeilii]|nr:hypothetical protein BDZ91DRAFT_447622 [Kalaharituber pfeilii]
MASSDGVDDQGKLNISNWHSQSQTHSSIMPLLGSKSQLHPGWQGMKEVTLLDVTIPRQQLDILEQDSAWFPRGDFHQGQHGKSFIPLKETPQPQDYKFERKAIQALQSTSPSLPEAIHLDDLASSSDSELSWSPSPHGSPTAASKTTYGMLPDNSSSQRLEEPKLASAEQGVCRRCLERNIICSRPPISPRITSQLIQTNHDEFGTSCEGCKAAGVSCIINEDGKTALNTWLEGSAYSEDIVEHRDVGAITRSPSRLSEMSAHNAINSASPSPREPLASYADPETSDFTFLMKVPSKVPKASQQRQNTGNSNCRGKMSVSKNKHSNSRLKHESKIQEIEDPMTGNLNSDTDEELPLMVDPSGATNVAKYGILRSQQIVAKKEEKKRRLERLSQGLPEVEVESLENETECSSYDGYSSSEERNETRRRMEESMTPGCKHDTDFDSRERDSSSVSHIPAIDVGSPSSSASNASIQLIKQEAHHEDEEETKAGQVTLIIEDKISDNSTDFVPLVSHHPKSLEQNSKQVEVAGNTAQFISASDLACHPTTDKQPKPVDSPCQIQKEGINSTQKIDEEDDDDDEIPQKAPISFEPSWSFSPAVFRPSRQAEGFHLLQSSKSVKLGDNDHLPKSKEDKTGTMDSIREKKPSPKSSHRQLPTSSTLNAKSTISENSHLGIEDADINLENATAGLKGIRSTDNNVVEDSPFPSTALRPDITIQVKDTPYNASKIISLDKAPINGDKASVKHGEDPHSTDSMFGGEDCIPATALKTASQEENSPNAPQANFAPRSDPLKGCKSHESEKQCAQHNKGQNFHSESSKRKLEVLLPVNAGVKRQLIQDEDGGGQPHRRKRLHIRKIDFGIQEQEYKDIKDVVREYKQKYLEIQSVDEQANVLQATDDSIAIEQAREEESPNRKPNHPQRKQNIPLVVPSKRPVLASSHEEIIRHASSLPARGIDKPVKRRKETQPPKRLSATQRALAALLAEKPPSLPNPYSPILYQSSSKTTPDTSFSSSSKSPQKVVRPYFRSPILGSHSPQPHPRSTSRRSSQTSHSLRNSVSLRELSLSPRKRGKAATYPEDTDGSDTADVIAARPTLAPQEVQKTLAPARGLTSLLQQETPEKIESYAGIKGQDIQVLIPGYNRFQALQKIRLDERRKAYFGPGELVMKDPEDIAENGIKRKEQLENMTAQKYTSPRTSEWWEEHDSPIKSFSRKYVQVKGVREGLAKSEGVTRVEVARLTSGAITRNVKRVMGSS